MNGHRPCVIQLPANAACRSPLRSHSAHLHSQRASYSRRQLLYSCYTQCVHCCPSRSHVRRNCTVSICCVEDNKFKFHNMLCIICRPFSTWTCCAICCRLSTCRGSVVQHVVQTTKCDTTNQSQWGLGYIVCILLLALCADSSDASVMGCLHDPANV